MKLVLSSPFLTSFYSFVRGSWRWFVCYCSSSQIWSLGILGLCFCCSLCSYWHESSSTRGRLSLCSQYFCLFFHHEGWFLLKNENCIIVRFHLNTWMLYKTICSYWHESSSTRGRLSLCSQYFCLFIINDDSYGRMKIVLKVRFHLNTWMLYKTILQRFFWKCLHPSFLQTNEH